MTVSVQKQDFLIQDVLSSFKNDNKTGASVSFVGYVRDFGDQISVGEIAMEIEHYPGMTEKALAKIEFKARKKWPINDIHIIHRYGKLKINDQIVLVVVSSSHRYDAFRACEFIIDFLKTDAPFWKKEINTNSENWVETNILDDKKKKSWEK